jgi:hypothetical protein
MNVHPSGLPSLFFTWLVFQPFHGPGYTPTGLSGCGTTPGDVHRLTHTKDTTRRLTSIRG